MARGKLPAKASSDQIQDFLRKVAVTPVRKSSEEPGRLIFALDATASREPTWDRASHLQAEMFQETAALGGLEIQLAFYRGFGEFKATKWAADQDTLLRQMTGVYCLAGETQIRKVLRHAVAETKKHTRSRRDHVRGASTGTPGIGPRWRGRDPLAHGHEPILRHFPRPEPGPRHIHCGRGRPSRCPRHVRIPGHRERLSRHPGPLTGRAAKDRRVCCPLR